MAQSMMRDVLVTQVVQAGLVRDVSELYRLKAEEVAGLERMGEKSALNVIEGIAGSRQGSCSRAVAVQVALPLAQRGQGQ